MPDNPAPPSSPAPSWVKHVALLTGVLAALAGFLTIRSTTLSNEITNLYNQAVLAQTQASDLWAEFQANSIKAQVIQPQTLPSSTLSADDKVALTEANTIFRQRQPVLKQQAQDKEIEREDRIGHARIALTAKNLIGYGSMAVQLAIALASVAAMTRKKWAFCLAIFAGVAGTAVATYAIIFGHLAGV